MTNTGFTLAVEARRVVNCIAPGRVEGGMPVLWHWQTDSRSIRVTTGRLIDSWLRRITILGCCFF